MGITVWITVGCVSWFVVSCGLGLVAGKFLAVVATDSRPGRAAEQ